VLSFFNDFSGSNIDSTSIKAQNFIKINEIPIFSYQYQELDLDKTLLKQGSK